MNTKLLYEECNSSSPFYILPYIIIVIGKKILKVIIKVIGKLKTDIKSCLSPVLSFMCIMCT